MRALERGQLALLLLCRYVRPLYMNGWIHLDSFIIIITTSSLPTHAFALQKKNSHRDVKPAKVLEPAATLAHVKGTPFFVLPKATAALGEALGLQRVAALGFKRPSGMNAEGGSDEAVRARIKSFLSFVLAKREFMTNAPPLPS